jgi:phospholipid/cholesterol/gamma-HCH transport system ATP-binding protein
MNSAQINKKIKPDGNNEQSPETVNNYIIEAKNLTKIFNKKVILDKINVGIEKGKTTVIIGPSGCGKTVLLKHLIVLLRPSSGELYFNHKRIDNLREKELYKVRTHYGFLFQGGALFDSLNVSDNIIFPITQHYKITDWKQVEELVKDKLAMVGLDGFQNYYPAELSGGQRKRVALARAIALNPEVILYDEPTTGLDPIRSDIINEIVLKLQRELNITSIVVTHDMKSVYKIADRIIMLHNGKIIADGNADYIRNHPHPIVQQFINGQVDDDDLALLRMKGSISQAQFQPHDFE